MTRSAEFDATVKQGTRVVQPDLIIHARHEPDAVDGPRVGFVVSKAVGNAVSRHHVARLLRHAARTVIDGLDSGDRVVIRALPSCRNAESPRLEREIAVAVQRARAQIGAAR